MFNPNNKAHWDFYIQKFEEWKQTVELKPLKIGCKNILDPEKMFESHMEYIRQRLPIYLPYLEHLIEYKNALSKQS